MNQKFFTSGWKDYELLDSGDKLRLEKVAGKYLVRPDSTALWKKSTDHPAWQKPDAVYLEGSWHNPNGLDVLDVTRGDITLHARLTSFKHLGFFPEQGAQWDWLREVIRVRNSMGKSTSVLNLFAYTGAATVVAAHAGASVCHVDAAKGSVNWASEHAAANNLSSAPIRWIVDDVRKFVQREVRRGSRYDAILLDPPVFGRGSKGEVWRLADHIYELVSDISQIYSSDPAAFLLNTYATELYPTAMLHVCEDLLPESMRGSLEVAPVGLISTENGRLMQTGDCVYWSAR